jgi:geranylgeranyl pyrophosphate synthase
LLRLLAGHAEDRRRRIAAVLAGSDSLDYTLDAARSHVTAALAALADLPESDARARLGAMAEFILLRRH